jgi:hypothetical protein
LIFIWQKSDIPTINSRRAPFSGVEVKNFKDREIDRERGGDGVIQNKNLLSFQLAFRLLSPCSQAALWKGNYKEAEAVNTGK